MIKGGNASDRDRALIAGHYVFSTPECQELKKEAQQALNEKNLNLNYLLKEELKASIYRYMANFRLIK